MSAPYGGASAVAATMTSPTVLASPATFTSPTTLMIPATFRPENIQPYVMHTSSKYLDLTKRKLELTRLPREASSPSSRPWRLGTPKKVLDPLIDFWIDQYDWRAQEAYYNEILPQYRTVIQLPGEDKSLRIHFALKQSAYPDSIPLLYCHGWPGSLLEASKVIDYLTGQRRGSRTRSGDSAAVTRRQTFHVVVPSIPGFAFSDASEDPDFGVRDTAWIFDALMRQLGYEQYVAHGTDGGFQICRSLAIHHQSSCVAIHTTNPALPQPTLVQSPISYLKYQVAKITGARIPSLAFGYEPSDLSIDSPSSPTSPTSTLPNAPQLPTGRASPFNELGYSHHPQTASYSLCDSPAGLLACILDALHYSPPGADLTNGSKWTATDMLNWTMLQWLPGPEAGLRWLRAGRKEARAQWEIFSRVPLGVSCFREGSESVATQASELSRGRQASDSDATIDLEAGVTTSKIASSPPMWAQSVQRLSWVRRHDESSRRPYWEEPVILAEDLKDFVGALLADQVIEFSRRAGVGGQNY